MSFQEILPLGDGLQRVLTIGWCVSALSMEVASVRYRALLPLLALEATHHRSQLFTPADCADLDALDVLILVKTFDLRSLELAYACKARNIPVIIDLCDNVLVEGYGRNKLLAHFLDIAKLATAMVVTTEPLAQFIRARLPHQVIHVIPDGLLTGALAAKGSQTIAAATLAAQSSKKPVRRPRKTFNARLKGLLALLRGTHRPAHKRAQLAQPQALACSSGHAQPGAKKLLWFGNPGASYARFGLLDLVDIRDALETIAREFPVELIVVSDHQSKYAQHIAPMAIASRYLQWSNAVVEHCLAEADVVLIPNSLDPFSISKSANRSVYALDHGVPVVATPTPALMPLAGCIALDGFVAGLRRYLGDPQAGATDVANARPLIDQHYDEKVIGRLWNGVLQGIVAPDGSCRRT